MHQSAPITILACTNRPGAISFSIAQYYTAALRKAGHAVQQLDLRALPADFTTSALYGNKGTHAIFNTLGDVIMQAEKMIWIVPEYNGSFPGVCKAFIDGLDVKKMKQHKVALVGLSEGHQGNLLGLMHLTSILHHIGMLIYPFKVTMPNLRQGFTSFLNHPDYKRLITRQWQGFINF